MDNTTGAILDPHRIDQLEHHLDQLANDPTLATDDLLFDIVGLRVTNINILPLIPRLLPKIIGILRRYQCDPHALCNLAIILVGPLDFHQVMSYASQEALIQALRSPAPSANLLAMTIVAKAAKSPSDAAVLAAMKDVVTSFVTRWLSAPEVEIGGMGTQVLGDLLMIDSPQWPIERPGECDESLREPARVTSNALGQGFVWRRIFYDRDVYDLILSLCSNGPHQSAKGGLSPYQLSLAQGRLLHLLPRLSVYHLDVVTKTIFPDIHQRYMNSEAPGGLLFFAALHMVDLQDTLMNSLFIEFFETLFNVQLDTPASTFKMDTLRKLYRAVIQNDSLFEDRLLSLPDRIIPQDGADALRQFIHDVATD
ncbi:hypothetical protein GQX73_g9170 [Xylaria multiplex]|uniref:Uncharacterized protein n=1 Tax=Xylaria multiplex TaxID=323545 RepID=A0A7C8MLS6_9PEZI|nr:hypothetical protein GQX73_g9170 [Xylaria multiplex]